MGGRFRSFEQTHSGMRMKFSGNYASSSDAVPEFDWRPKKKMKKRSSAKIERILCLKSSENQRKKKKKEKRSSPQFGTIRIRTQFGFYSCWQPLFCLFIQTLTLSGESAEISLGETLKCRWGNANSQWGTRAPYNLSTGYRLLTATSW